MISVECRRRFAAFLLELAEGHPDAQNWLDLIVEHYHDQRLESIRSEVACSRAHEKTPPASCLRGQGIVTAFRAVAK